MPSEEDLLNMCMPEEMQEEMFCFTMGDCEFSEIKPAHQKQLKKCEFMNASIHIAQMPFSYEGASFQMPCLVISNDDFDADQDQKPEEKLPLAESLIFMRYETAEEPEVTVDADGVEVLIERSKVGYVFFYPELGESGACYVVEADPNCSKTMRDEL